MNAGGSVDRARAARALVKITSADLTTDQTIGHDPTPLLRELVYGTLRHYFLLQPLIDAHLKDQLRTKDLDLRCLLLVGAYQLQFMRVPRHAVVNETVNACRHLKKPWARGLINAVLRKIASLGSQDPAERSFGVPAKLVEQFESAYPERATELMAATLERAPMSLRVNTARLPTHRYAARLTAEHIDAGAGWTPENLVLAEPRGATALPGFAQGEVSIQDAGAMFAAGLVGSATKDAHAPRILDACAAPGGKLFHLAERLPGASLAGIERQPERFAHLTREAERLGHTSVELIQADATDRDWYDGRPFHAILLDAPCSGSGTLRRHPEIKLRLPNTDLSAHLQLQRALLDNLFDLLVPGGEIIYCTCSLLPDENDRVIGSFIAEHPQARVRPIALPLGQPTQFGWQLLPLLNRGAVPNKTVDGFYYARLTHAPKAS